MDTSLPTNIFVSNEGFDYEIIDRIDCTASLKDENGELNIPQVTEKPFRVVFNINFISSHFRFPSMSMPAVTEKKSTAVKMTYNIEN